MARQPTLHAWQARDNRWMPGQGGAAAPCYFENELLSLTYIRNGYIIQSVTRNLSNAPLTPAVLHILLALSTEERHGYEIMKQVESDSQGKVKMGPGTLYGSFGRMMEAGLI